MADEENGDTDEDVEYVLAPPAEETGAAGEAILEALSLHDPQSEAELMTNTGLERGLIVLGGRRLEREGRVRIVGDGPDARMYWLKT
jgi:hypothetical protein